jgi:DNA polymerase-1
MLRQQLIDLSTGEFEKFYRNNGKVIPINYRLNDLTARFLGEEIEGKGTTQLEYGPLIQVPFDLWPERYITYAKADIDFTWKIFLLQEHLTDVLADQHRQAKKAMWLQLQSAYGVRSNKHKVDLLEAKKRLVCEELEEELIRDGLLQWRGPKKQPKRKLVKNIPYARQLVEYYWPADMGEVPRTKPSKKFSEGQVSTEKDVIETIVSRLDEKTAKTHPLNRYRDYSKASNYLSKDIPALRLGCDPNRIHTRYMSLRATGRVSSRGPNVQNWKREEGSRECIEPTPGYVFVQADFDGFELHSWAQVCYTLIGYSRLREVLNSGIDPHLQLASIMLNVSYDECLARYKAGDPQVDNMRQVAKIANFGFPGGLGAERFVEYAWKNYEVRITFEFAKYIRDAWFKAWPEARAYFKYINSLNGYVVQLFTDRIRAGASFTQSSNSLFQGLAIDAANFAGWNLAKACYVDTRSVLYNSRPVLFIHDEFIVESPRSIGHECAQELKKIMVESATPLLRDVPPKATPCLMNFWSKKAKPTFNEEGRLVPWEPVDSLAA